MIIPDVLVAKCLSYLESVQVFELLKSSKNIRRIFKTYAWMIPFRFSGNKIRIKSSHTDFADLVHSLHPDPNYVRPKTIMSNELKYLRDVHTIILEDIDFIGFSFKYFKNVRDISFVNVINVKFKHLRGVRNINFDGTDINYKELKYLKGIHTINLEMTNIKCKNLRYLSGVHTIDLKWSSITDKGLEHLKGVHTIDLQSTNITDEGLVHLKGVHTIQLFQTCVTGPGLIHLSGVHTINLKNTSVTDKDVAAS